MTLITTLRCEVLGLVLLAAGWTPSIVRAERCLQYGPVVVDLTGKIVLRTFFGPPNYGEDPAGDRRETQGVLELDRPICVVGDPSDNLNSESERDQRVVTLVPSQGMDLRRYANQRVTVSGTLFHAHTAHHSTRVLLTISRVTPIATRSKAKPR